MLPPRLVSCPCVRARARAGGVNEAPSIGVREERRRFRSTGGCGVFVGRADGVGGCFADDEFILRGEEVSYSCIAYPEEVRIPREVPRITRVRNNSYMSGCAAISLSHSLCPLRVGRIHVVKARESRQIRTIRST